MNYSLQRYSKINTSTVHLMGLFVWREFLHISHDNKIFVIRHQQFGFATSNLLISRFSVLKNFRCEKTIPDHSSRLVGCVTNIAYILVWNASQSMSYWNIIILPLNRKHKNFTLIALRLGDSEKTWYSGLMFKQWITYISITHITHNGSV